MIKVSPYLLISNENGEMFIENFLSKSKRRLDNNLLGMLKFCLSARTFDEAAEGFGKEYVEQCLNEKLLLFADKMHLYTNIHMVDIETVTSCNYKCAFCPVAYDERAGRDNRIMDMDLFKQITDKAVRHPSVREVSLHFYGEPTLDTFFCDRINIISGTRLRLHISTNASYLDAERLEALAQNKGSIQSLNINLPSIEESEYERLTSSGCFSGVMQNIESACLSGLPVKILVNGTKKELVRNLDAVKDYFAKYQNTEVIVNNTHDCCGLLKNEYKQELYLDTLIGCEQFIGNLTIGVSGEIIMCSNDYYKKTVIGNIADGEIIDIINSDAYIRMSKKIMNIEPPDEDFLCHKCWNASAYRYLLNMFNRTIKSL